MFLVWMQFVLRESHFEVVIIKSVTKFASETECTKRRTSTRKAREDNVSTVGVCSEYSR
jgi:hypothetical protein